MIPMNFWFSTVKTAFLLVGDTHSRWSMFARLVDTPGHCKQDCKQALTQSMLPK
jgi:hypothetical protein